MSSIETTMSDQTIKVRLWFRDINTAQKAIEQLEDAGIVKCIPGSSLYKPGQVVYLKTWQEFGPRGWGFYDEEQGTLAKIAVGDMTIEDRS